MGAPRRSVVAFVRGVHVGGVSAKYCPPSPSNGRFLLLFADEAAASIAGGNTARRLVGVCRRQREICGTFRKKYELPLPHAISANIEDRSYRTLTPCGDDPIALRRCLGCVLAPIRALSRFHHFYTSNRTRKVTNWCMFAEFSANTNRHRERHAMLAARG